MIATALACLAAVALAAIYYDAYRQRRCAWCGLTRPTLRHYFDTHHRENQP